MIRDQTAEPPCCTDTIHMNVIYQHHSLLRTVQYNTDFLVTAKPISFGVYLNAGNAKVVKNVLSHTIFHGKLQDFHFMMLCRSGKPMN